MNCFPFIFRRKKSSQELSIPTNEEIPGIDKVRIYSLKELKHATEAFSPANKIGEGGFGSVYKGRLRDGTVVAIKVLSSESQQGIREFLSELATIANVIHENLVELFGCCVEGDQRILVYDYLANNSLARTLLGVRGSNIQFNWGTRTKICIGVARGLVFLHEEVQPHIVHRDIKASNILLDEDLNAKISDFGLAKLLPSNVTHVSTRVAGTIGYLAPEYAISGRLTRKVDIYSFGVLLLEIVSGRCNTNARIPTEDQLLEKTWELHERNELVSIVDPTLNGDFDAEEVCRFLKVGLLCTQDTPKLRPSMSTVVLMLTGEMDVNLETITKPGLISDFMDFKLISQKKPKDITSTNTMSSGFTNDKFPLSSEITTHASFSFTAISDREG
uniref:Putative leucine-rich repeat receptor-like serine/threonine-protein kinase At3g14840 n=1 Tax=Anthurium amnicola TaxID=1678845 RepID=A0A1D1ZA17_9ARAE